MLLHRIINSYIQTNNNVDYMTPHDFDVIHDTSSKITNNVDETCLESRCGLGIGVS